MAGRLNRTEYAAGSFGPVDPPLGIKTLAPSDLLHQYRITQDIEGMFQVFVLIVIDQDSGGFSVAHFSVGFE